MVKFLFFSVENAQKQAMWKYCQRQKFYFNGHTIGFPLKPQKAGNYKLNKYHHVKVLLKGFHLNGLTIA